MKTISLGKNRILLANNLNLPLLQFEAYLYRKKPQQSSTNQCLFIYRLPKVDIIKNSLTETIDKNIKLIKNMTLNNTNAKDYYLRGNNIFTNFFTMFKSNNLT